MDPIVLRNALEAFLKSEHGLTLSDAEFPDIQGLPQVQLALEFFEKRFTDSAPLAAIISQVPQTAVLYEIERKQLYALLKSALSFNRETRSFGVFNERAAQISLNETRDLKRPAELRLLHESIRNVGLQEKFLRNQLQTQEWLSDLDLKRLLTTMNLQNTITVTRLDALDIGMALHFARRQHAASTEPYSVRLLLNKGERGNYKSQGSHWMEAVLTITPGVPSSVVVNFSDSLAVSDAEKARVFAMIDEGIAFREEVPSDPTKNMEAFPRATVIHAEPEIGGQHDAWSCGYRALAKSLSRIPIADLTVEAQRVVAAAGSATELRDCVYELSLAHLQVPLTAMQSVATTLPEQDSIFESTVEGSRLSKAFLEDYLKSVSITHAHTRVAALTQLKDMREKIALDEKVAASKKQVQEQLHIEESKATLDIAKLFAGITKGSLDEKAMVLALVAQINEARITALNFDGIDADSLSEEHVDLFYQLAFVKKITSTVPMPEAFAGVFKKIEVRNELMAFLKIEIDSEEDIWQQLYAARMANPGLFFDASAAEGVFNLFSISNNDESISINRSILSAPEEYLKALFRFLEENKKFLSENPARFSYKKFSIGDQVRAGGLAQKYAEAEGMSLLAERSLALLADHLENGRYFPFNTLIIQIHHTTGGYFSQLERILKSLKNYPNITRLQVELDKGEGYESFHQKDDFSLEEYKKITQIFADEGLSVNLKLKSLERECRTLDNELTKARMDLLNTIAINRRARAIAKRSGQCASAPLLVEEEVAASPLKKGAVRACKLAGFNVRQALSLDVSLERQAEQQHQVQTTLQQDVQQALEVQAQEQAEVSTADSATFSSLLSKEYFLEEGSRIISRTGAIYQKQWALVDRLLVPEDASLIWDDMMGGALEHSIRYLTPQAFARIAAFPQFFLHGINIDNLPEGFFVQKNSDTAEYVLCYDPMRYLENKSQSPLTLKLTGNYLEEGWSGDYRQIVPQETSNEKIFSFNGIQADRKNATREMLFEWMRHLNAALSETIIEKHAWIFAQDHRDSFAEGVEISLLIDLLYHEGCEGLMVLLDTLKVMRDADPDLYQHFKHYVISDHVKNRSFIKESLMELMTDNHLAIIKKLPELTPVQKVWWKKILELQVGKDPLSGTDYVDLGVLYEGFMYFLKKIPETVMLPATCPLEGDNPLLQLDRLLVCLSKVKPAHLQDQLDHLAGLDFGMEGAWYAARFNGFHFFHESMQLKPVVDEFGVAERQSDYKVDYADLVAVCATAAEGTDPEKDFTDAKIAFYRYVGRSKHIALPYENYIALLSQLSEWAPKDHGEIRLKRVKKRQPGIADIRKLTSMDDDYEHDSIKFQLLPLLAIATTGPRGAKLPVSLGLMKFLDEIDRETLEDIIPLLTERLHRLEHQPNLHELFSLLVLLVESADPTSAVDILLDFKNSEEQLSALELWRANKNHLSANQFIQFYQAIKEKDAEHLDDLLRIAALMKHMDGDINLFAFMEALLALQSRPDYNGLLKLLANIDLAETTTDHLPAFPDLLRILRDLQSKPVKSGTEIYRYLLTELPNVKFNRAATLEGAPTNFSEQLLAHIEAFNEELVKYGVAPWDMQVMQSVKAIDYLTEQYEELYATTLPKIIQDKPEFVGVFKQAAILAAQMVVRSKVSAFLQGIFLAPLAGLIDEFKALGKLKSEYGHEPAVSGDPATFKEELTKLSRYSTAMENLFEVLVALKRQFGDTFKLDFLLNSPVLHNYSQESLTRIFSVLREQELGFIPTSLFTAIFDHPGFAEGVDTDALSAHITEIIAMDQLSVKQRAALVSALYQHTDKADELLSLVKNLTDAKTHFTNVESVLFDLSLKVLGDADSKLLLKGIGRLLEIFKEFDKKVMDPAGLMMLRYALKYDEGIAQLKLLGKIVDGDINREYLKSLYTILAHSYFKNPSNETSDLTQIMASLFELYQKDVSKFNQILHLYDQPPRPGVSVLKKLLEGKWTVEAYQKDPYGDRADAVKLAQQFSIDTVHDRVDTMVDLGRRVSAQASAPALFYTHRQKLYDGIAYVTAVGHAHPLSLRDTMHAECVRPVMDLTHAEIKSLLQHYRTIISNPEASADDVWLARLEALALVREALYRTQGKMAYDTQLLSVLNLMLQGGNVFSEIRTGEGKSIVTAMMAVMKWMEGGAVDVCSSNMSLAARDLEENSDFFEYLGISASLIRASSTHSAYQKDGINYSDISELSLFQEQQLLLGETLAEKCSLVLDEVDFNVLDNTTQFRFATSLDKDFDPHFNPYQDLYIHVIHFVQQDDFLRKECSAKQDIVNLRDYIRSLPDSVLAASKKARFLSLSDEWLDRWIDAAYTAIHLREDEDYVIRERVIVRNEEELETSQAQVKINFRANPDSRFSDGVHQFLHALLNERMAKEADFKRKCHDKPFVIEPEKTYLASRSAKNTIDYYLRSDANGQKRGDVVGLTGTIGTYQDCAELNENYAAKFFRIPPHKVLRRQSLPSLVARRQGVFKKETAQAAHFREILKDIKAAQKRGQCVLVICDGVQSSQKLYEFLEPHLAADHLQLHNGEQVGQTDEEVTQKAGVVGQVTISTPMFGRGTDIKPQTEAGLHVTVTSMADEREYGQNVGRAGRNGAIGSDRLILSEDVFTSRGKKIPSASHLEASIKEIRDELAGVQRSTRYEKQVFSDVKDQFFKQYTEFCRRLKADIRESFAAISRDDRAVWNEISREQHIQWEAFLKFLDADWSVRMTALANAVDAFRKDEVQLITSNPQLSKKEKDKKLSELDVLVERKKTELLAEHLKEHTQKANQKWQVTCEVMLAKANLRYQTAYGKVAPAAQAGSGSSDGAVDTPLVASAKVLSYTPQRAHVSLGAVPAVPMKLDFVMSSQRVAVPSQPSVKKPLESYIALTRNDTTAEKQRALMFKLNVTEQRHIDSRIKAYAQSFLESAYEKAHRGWDASYFMGDFSRLCKTVASYGNNAQKQILREVIDQHLESVRVDKSYDRRGAYLLNIEGLAQKAGIASAVVFETHRASQASDGFRRLSSESKVSVDNSSSWIQTYELAKKLIQDDYLDRWFMWRSSDRKDVANGLMMLLERLNTNSDLSEQAKFSQLATALDNASEAMLKDDLAADQASKHSWFGRYRNEKSEGSRLQSAVRKVREFIMAVNTAPVGRVDVGIKMVELIAQLNMRADEFDLAFYKNIKLSELSNEFTLQNYQQYQVIYHYLQAVRQQLSQTHEHAGFRSQVDVTLAQLQLWLLQAAKQADIKDELEQKPQFKFREALQQSLAQLVRIETKDTLHRNPHPLSTAGIQVALRYAETLKTLPAEHHALLAKGLFEIERLLQIGNPHIKKIEFLNVNYQEAELKVEVKIGGDQTLNLSIHDFRIGGQVVCACEELFSADDPLHFLEGDEFWSDKQHLLSERQSSNHSQSFEESAGKPAEPVSAIRSFFGAPLSRDKGTKSLDSDLRTPLLLGGPKKSSDNSK